MKAEVLRDLLCLVVVAQGLACDSTPPSESAKPAVSPAEPAAKAEPIAKAEPAPAPVVEPEPAAEPIAKPEPVAKPEPPKPVPPRTALLFREAPKGRLKVWALPDATAADPTAAQDLGIVADDNGGSIDYGTSTPVLAADGQWLAFLDDGRLEIARVDGTARHRITKDRASKVEVLIAGFTPDSSALLFHQGEVQTEEGAPLPKGVVPGFHLLALADQTLQPKTSLESFTTFTDDGKHVILTRRLPDRSTVLARFSLDTGAEEELQKSTDLFAFSQLALHGDRIAYGKLFDKELRIVTDTLAGGKLVEIAAGATFAQYQWPRFSLDGQLVSYTDETSLMVRGATDDAPRLLTTCAVRHCIHVWDSATTVLVLDDGKLSRVSLDGTVAPLASDVEGFVVAGMPG